MPPNALSELLPLLCRFCRKPVRNDCRADVSELDVEPLAVVPPKSPINCSNAEFRLDRVFEDKLEEELVLLISWLSLRSWIKACSAEMMSCCPYAVAPAAPAAGVVAALAAATGVVAVDEVSLLAAGAVDGGVAMPVTTGVAAAATGVAVAAVTGAAVTGVAAAGAVPELPLD